MHKGIDSSALKMAVGLVLFTGLAIGLYHLIGAQRASAQTEKKGALPSGFDAVVRNNSEQMMKEGQQTFRFDTFGSEAFWGDALQLHFCVPFWVNWLPRQFASESLEQTLISDQAPPGCEITGPKLCGSAPSGANCAVVRGPQ